MNDNPSSERDTIEALADSFVTRFRAGQRPSIEEYARRYPELADELRELLPALVLLEQNGAPDETAPIEDDCSKTLVPSEIGDFTIVREIGRGGMGVVYEAVEQSLGRHVALKVLSTPALLNVVHMERFRLEARAAARLHHTHIVPVFGIGEHNGLHFYAMQFIQGQSLDLVIDELRYLRRQLDTSDKQYSGDEFAASIADGMLTGQFRIRGTTSTNESETIDDLTSQTAADTHSFAVPANSVREFTTTQAGREFYHSVARVGLQVAEALSYSHSEGILHRDIKPSNLLLDAKGNVWVTDFGLARDESTDGLTQTGDFVGTLRYMAPERLEGWSDRRSDLYSLGATLYELLTLRTFLGTAGRSQLVDKILHENPPPPSSSDHQIPRDLETIVLKAINKEPSLRYHAADDMAQDLGRFLADRPILARRSTPTEQFLRWCRRSPGVAGLSGAVAALLIAAVAILTMSNAEIRREIRAKSVALKEKDAALQREVEQRREAEIRVKIARAQNLCDALEFIHAEALMEEVPIEFIRREPELSARVFNELARWCGGEKNWKKSSSYYHKLFFGPAKGAWAPPPGIAFLEYAPVLIEVGDLSDYQRLRESATAAYADSTQGIVCEQVLGACLLLPADNSQMLTYNKWAETITHYTDVHPIEYAYAARALLEYRQNEHDQALEWSRKCLNASPGPACAARGHIVMALAYAELNQPEEARAALESVRDVVESRFTRHLGIGRVGYDWWADWLINRILLREANTLIGSLDATAAGRVRTDPREVSNVQWRCLQARHHRIAHRLIRCVPSSSLNGVTSPLTSASVAIIERSSSRFSQSALPAVDWDFFRLPQNLARIGDDVVKGMQGAGIDSHPKVFPGCAQQTLNLKPSLGGR